MTDQGEQASVCPTCGSDDPKKRLPVKIAPSSLEWKRCANDKFHPPVAAPRDPQKLVDALREILSRFPDDEVLDMLKADSGYGHRYCPPTKVPRDDDVVRWRAALKDWEENQ